MAAVIRPAVAIALVLIASAAYAADDNDPVLHVGKDVTSPRVLRKVDPVYSIQAENDRIQGTVLYSIVVDKSGKARNIEVLSPIGHGLDEKGIEAIQKWIFAPAMKDGVPVSVIAQVEVNFRFHGSAFDAKAEEQRTMYNASVHDLQNLDKKQKAVERINKLAADQYPPGMSLLGLWMIDGSEAPKDVPAGIELAKKAAEKSDGTGLFIVGKLYLDGSLVPADAEKGLKLMQDASIHGSAGAQFYLGAKYESVADFDRARKYFRLCASRAIAACQFRLGKLLIPAQGTSTRDLEQALAWLELARDGSVKEADALIGSLQSKLSADEITRAEKLKPQLLQK